MPLNLHYSFVTLLIICLIGSSPVAGQELYKMSSGVQTRWASPENPEGAKGEGAKENNGAKGHAFDTIAAGDSLDLLNVKGAGKVTRIKLTTDDRSPKMLRSLRIEMYWDGASTPAVSAPLGDFFGLALGKTTSFENALFANPEGRSFVATLPMPYKKGGRIVVHNDSEEDLGHIFYDVEFEKWEEAPKDMLYFHAYWHRNTPDLGKDFEILPELKGNGKYIGTNIGINADPAYGNHWWGEGEIKFFLDGDDPYPSLVGTGVEDYIGTAWGQGEFQNRTEGSLIADWENLQWAFYRYHLEDPVYFHNNLRIQIQQIGGGPLNEVRQIFENGAPMDPISVDGIDESGKFYKLKEMENPPKLDDKDFPKGWTNYFRKDDWSSTAYFYLDRPENNLPGITPVEERTKN